MEHVFKYMFLFFKQYYMYFYTLFHIHIVWANFALGSNSVKGKARPNVLCEGIRTSEDDQPRNG